MLSVIGVVLFANVLLPTSGQSNATITITASIEPARTIVVDDSYVIKKIISNTSLNIPPTVVMGSESGVKVEATSTVIKEYNEILESLGVVGAGIVYDYERDAMLSFIHSIFGKSKKLNFEFV